jgi:hypothetical protein
MTERNALYSTVPLDCQRGIDSPRDDLPRWRSQLRITEPLALWPLVLYFAAVVGLVAATLGISYVLGMRHTARAADEPFESGIVSTGSARIRFSAKFYLIAMFFVIFE